MGNWELAEDNELLQLESCWDGSEIKEFEDERWSYATPDIYVTEKESPNEFLRSRSFRGTSPFLPPFPPLLPPPSITLPFLQTS